MRKWTYLVATLLMAGTTATFTGCIDTDEPEGIANLRGAKAELIKAETAVKQVEVEMQKALIVNQELQNKALEIANQRAEYDNQLKALDVKLKELDVELKQAQNEAEKARLEAEIAQSNANKAAIENQMALDAETFKALMLDAQAAAVRAQQSYDEAMRALEASKLTLTDAEREAIEKAQLFMQQSAMAMDIKYDALKDAQDAYYDALVNPSLPSLSSLQADLKIAQIAVEKAEIMLDEKSNMLALAEDFDAAAWDTKIQELDKKISEYQSEKSKVDVELATKKASSEYKAAEEKVAEMVKARRTAKKAYDEAVADSAAQVDTYRDIKAYESEPINAGLKKLFSTNSDFRALARVGEYDLATGVFSYPADQYKQTEYNNDLDIEDEALRTSAASVRLRRVEAWIEALKNFTVDENGVEWNKLALAEKEKLAETATDQYKNDKANWEISAKAVKGTATDVPTDKLKEVTDAYNASFTKVVNAVKAYNDVYDEIYKTAYDEYISTQKAALKKGYYLRRLEDALNTKGTAGQKLDYQSITGDDAQIKWLETNLPGEVSAASTGADTDVETYYKDATNNQTLLAGAETAGNNAFAATDKDEKALAALDEAAQEANAAARKVPSARTAFKQLAADVYGQKLVNNVTLADMTGTASFYGDEVDDNNNPTGHKEVLRSDITAEEFAKLSETKLDHYTALNALSLTSNTVFGSILSSQDRLLEVSPKMVREYIEENGGSLLNFGSLGIMMAANDDVQLCKDMIEAAELIKPLQAQMDAVYANLDAEIKANTALMDPFIEKADETRVAWMAAKEDVKTAEEERDALTAEFEANSQKFDALITDYQGLKAIVQQQIDGINNGVVSGSTITVESVLNYWKNEVAKQEKAVETAKQSVTAAEKRIELFNKGEYTEAYVIEQKKNALQTAQEAYDAAKAIYDAALAQVKTVIAALTK